MKIKVWGNEVRMEKQEGVVDDFYSYVKRVLTDNSLCLNHMVIDGTVVSDGYDQYISENLDNIEFIDVKADPLIDLLDDALRSGSEYLKRAIPEIRDLGNEFYRTPGGETWKKFQQMLEGLEWIMQLIHSINANRNFYLNGERYEEFGARLNEELANLNDAVSRKDMVLIGDLILYEILPLLESVEKTVDEATFEAAREKT